MIYKVFDSVLYNYMYNCFGFNVKFRLFCVFGLIGTKHTVRALLRISHNLL